MGPLAGRRLENMAPMRAPRSALGLVCLLACGSLLVAGCGGGSGTSSQVNPEAESGVSHPAPPASAFPSAMGKDLREVLEEAAHAAELKVTPSAQVFYPGVNRYPFTIAEKVTGTGEPGQEVPDAEAALYYAKVPKVRPGAKAKAGNRGLAGKAQSQALEEPALGPFPARIESLATSPPSRARRRRKSLTWRPLSMRAN